LAIPRCGEKVAQASEIVRELTLVQRTAYRRMSCLPGGVPIKYALDVLAANGFPENRDTAFGAEVGEGAGRLQTNLSKSVDRASHGDPHLRWRQSIALRGEPLCRTAQSVCQNGCG
jgi:hypothetical protein